MSTAKFQSVHCLSLPHIVPFDDSVSLCPLLPSTVCGLSVSTSHCTVCCFCVTMSTAVFYSLSTLCQYLKLYGLMIMCHYVHCCLLQSVQRLSVPQNKPSVGSVSLYPLLSSKVFPLSVSTSHYTVCWFCVTKSTAVFYNLYAVFQYLTLYRLLVLCHYFYCCLPQFVHCLSVPPLYRLMVLCHYVHCYLLQTVHCLSVTHTVPSVGSVSHCPLLPSTFCPLSLSTSHSI